MRISYGSSDVCSADLQVARREGQGAARPLALVHLPDELGDAVDQNILVVDRRQPFDAGDDFVLVAVMLVAEHAPIGFGRERENRTLHRGHVILEIGRASCREGVCPYGSSSVVAGSSHKKSEQRISTTKKQCKS